MAQISGKLTTIADPEVGFAPEPGSVEIALCGYGSQTPRSPGGTLARLTVTVVPEDPGDPIWQVIVSGNDVIQPAGTFYTITTKDSNGDIAQVNAYTFADGGEYDVNQLPPFDPNQPPAPIPPPITNLLLIVPYSTAPEFPGDEFTSWQITLNGDAWPTFTNLEDGNLYTIIIIQDANGNHEVTWPTNVYNTTPVNPDPDSLTIQTFVAISNELYPIGAATYYP